ncbi:MAG: arginine deiminase family protein [Woeseia sp.]
MNRSAKVYEFDNAIVRRPAASVVRGLRADDRGDPDFAVLQAEHAAYVAALENAGVTVQVLAADDAFPDSVFVEDPALVYGEGAIVLRPGAATRLGEANKMKPVLADRFATVLEMTEDGFAEGGDILTTPKTVMIGLSARTDRAGAESVIHCLRKLGRDGEIVQTPPGVLHFKTDCSLLDEETVLSTKRLAASGFFAGYRTLLVPEGEEAAANALRVNDVVFIGADFPRTIDLLAASGYTVVSLNTREIGKVDAGLSCMSLRWHSQPAPAPRL